MILGTWNLQVYPCRYSARGNTVAQELGAHTVDVWFLTELHADWEVAGYTVSFSEPRNEMDGRRRLSAIASRWDIEPVPSLDNPAEPWLCLAHLTDPATGMQVLAVSSVLPWRGMSPSDRYFQNRDMTCAEALRHVLGYTVQRIQDERRPGEEVVWGGDFNQALSGRDYVGTNRGREELFEALNQLSLQSLTFDLPALIPNHPAIDHICVPKGWSLCGTPAVYRPTDGQQSLSDHALYLAETQPQ